MRLARCLPGLLFAALAAGSASAQTGGTISAGSGAAQLGSGSSTGIVSLAPAFHLTTRNLWLTAQGDYVEHADRGWQTTGLVSTGLRLPATGSLTAELVGTAAWSRLSWGRAAAGALGEARLEAPGAGLRGWTCDCPSAVPASRSPEARPRIPAAPHSRIRSPSPPAMIPSRCVAW
jgi:hypothetical protein